MVAGVLTITGAQGLPLGCRERQNCTERGKIMAVMEAGNLAATLAELGTRELGALLAENGAAMTRADRLRVIEDRCIDAQDWGCTW